MQRALKLARGALGSVSPNPAVGAVLVRDGHIVGQGYTQPPGGPHAEVQAIRDAGNKAFGATMYVTLEPCNHFGRTPPCTQAVIEAGVIEIHVATVDPNPRVEGGGLAKLREANIRVITDVNANDTKQARQIIEAFAKHSTTRLPFVTAKFAASLDGKIATRTGDSKWITSQSSRAYVHELRGQSDAIMAGIGTVIADDPQLTARDSDGNTLQHQPLRVIIDSKGRTPANARLLSQPGGTLIVTGETSDLESTTLNAKVESFPNSDGSVDLTALLKHLGEHDITSVFVEGGGTLLGSLFDLGIIDKVVGFVAPVIIGGAAALSPVGGEGAELMRYAKRLRNVEIKQFGDDVAIIGYCGEPTDVYGNS